MSSAQPDYYAVLGLNAKSSQTDIKKRYRELARRYHPDVNSSPDAAQKIKTINEAYHVLGDAERRATFDASRIFQPQMPRPAAPSQPPRSAAGSTAAGARTANPNPSDSRPFRPAPADTASTADFDFNGFGRVVSEAARRAQSGQGSSARAAAPPRPASASPPAAPPSRGAAPPASPSRSRTPAQRKAQEDAAHVQQLLNEAKLAFINRKYSDAERMCRQAIRLDSRSAIGYELLGDSARKQGNTEEAIQAYSVAVQLNPRNHSVQANLDRLIGTSGKPGSSGPTLARAAKAPLAQRLSRDVIVNGAGGLAALGVVLLLGILYIAPGAAFVSDLSLNLLVTLILCGLLGGFLLALYGGLRPQSQELAARGDGRSPVPLSGVLSLLALVWFGVSLLAYLLVAMTQNRVSASVLRAYALTLFMSVVFVCAYHPFAGSLRSGFSVMAAAFAGNLLFPTILLGWKLGDNLRLQRYSG